MSQVVAYPPEAHEAQAGMATAPSGVVGRMLDRVERSPDGDLLTYYQGLKHPTRGLGNPYALGAANIVKKYLRSMLFIVAKSPLRYLVPFILILPPFMLRKFTREVLNQTADFCWLNLYPYYLKPDWYSRPVRELLRTGLAIGIDHRLVKSVCVILEYDRPYRYRIQDILSEMNLRQMRLHPAREAGRLAKLYAEREHAKNWRPVTSLIPVLVFLRPELKKLLKAFAWEIDKSELAMLPMDKYHAYAVTDYDYEGKSHEERRTIWDAL